MHIACGAALADTTVGSTRGWEFAWVLRNGEQDLEQHKCMECRWVSLVFSGVTAPSNFSVSARTREKRGKNTIDSHFNSSSSMLNAVFELCRYTLEAASLDTPQTPTPASGVHMRLTASSLPVAACCSRPGTATLGS